MRDLGADEAAELGILVVDHDLVAQHGEVARDRQRGRAAADAGDPLAVLLRRLGHGCQDAVVVLVVGGDALEAADRDRLLLALDQRLVLDAAAAAGRLAGTVAGAAENSREDVGLPVDHVGVGIAPVGDQPDVFGDGGVRGASPLAIHDLVEVVGIRDVGRLQQKLQAANFPVQGRRPVNDGLEYKNRDRQPESRGGDPFAIQSAYSGSFLTGGSGGSYPNGSNLPGTSGGQHAAGRGHRRAATGRHIQCAAEHRIERIIDPISQLMIDNVLKGFRKTPALTN